MELTWFFGKRLAASLAVVALVGCDKAPGSTGTALERAQQGRVLWEEKCRTLAGVKVYRRVEEVEGVVLLKIRPGLTGGEWADPLWPGAAFADEARDEDYIESFLGYEEALGPDGQPREITPTRRGYISTTYKPEPKPRPGYRRVDIPDTPAGRYLRYRLLPKKKEGSKIGWIDLVLDRSFEDGTDSRYAVTYEDEVNVAERALGVASSTVRVVDLANGEVLGELRRFAWSVPASSANPRPWLTARKCPAEAVGSDAATRKFVDQVLIPARDR